MPENISGRPGVPPSGDSEQWIRDTLARMVDDLAALTCAVADLAKRIGDAEAEAEDILRRASGPPPPPRQRAPIPSRRRGDTFLRVVKALAIALAGAGLILGMVGHAQRVAQQGCYIQPATGAARCWQPVVQDLDGPGR